MGVVEIAPEQVLDFVAPILGFESYRRFVILPDPDASPFHWLQSVEEKGVAFPVVSAVEIDVDYRSDAESLAQFGASGWDKVNPWIILIIPRDGSEMRVNLRAPVVVNPGTRLGGQIVLRDEYPVSHVLSCTTQRTET